MKNCFIALAGLAAVAIAQASPLGTSDIALRRADGSLKEVRVVAPSIFTPSIDKYMRNLCGGNSSYDIYLGERPDEVNPSASVAFACYTASAAKTGTAGYPVGTPLLVVVTRNRPSIYGVVPVYARLPENAMFVDPGTCGIAGGGTNGTTNYCTGPNLHIPQVAHAGLSELEPARFVQPTGLATPNYPGGTPYLNVPNRISGQYVGTVGEDDTGATWPLPTPRGMDSVGALDAQPIQQIVYGLAVSSTLYAKLQRAQGTSGVPSVPRTFATAYLSGFVRSASSSLTTALHLSAVTGDKADDASTPVICREGQGSGTQAVANLFFLKVGDQGSVALGALLPAASKVSLDSYDTTTYSGLTVFEGENSGYASRCLSSLSDLAMGVLQLDQDVGAHNWRFVSIDGAYPDLGNLAAHTGDYPFVFASTMQWHKAAIDANMRGFLANMRSYFKDSAALVTTYSPLGMMAPPYGWDATPDNDCIDQVPFTFVRGAEFVSTYLGSCVERGDPASKYTRTPVLQGLSSLETLHRVK